LIISISYWLNKHDYTVKCLDIVSQSVSYYTMHTL